MKSIVISKNLDTITGFRLAGIHGVLVKSDDETLEVLKKNVKNSSIGIIILSDEVFSPIQDLVMDIKKRIKTPLIIPIPGKNGLTDKDFILKYVKESMGIKI